MNEINFNLEKTKDKTELNENFSKKLDKEWIEKYKMVDDDIKNIRQEIIRLEAAKYGGAAPA